MKSRHSHSKEEEDGVFPKNELEFNGEFEFIKLKRIRNISLKNRHENTHRRRNNLLWTKLFKNESV